MILTSNLINDFFDDSFAIRTFNNYKSDNVTHNDDGATIIKNQSTSLLIPKL